jgi:hypothetical protein
LTFRAKTAFCYKQSFKLNAKSKQYMSWNVKTRIFADFKNINLPCRNLRNLSILTYLNFKIQLNPLFQFYFFSRHCWETLGLLQAFFSVKEEIRGQHAPPSQGAGPDSVPNRYSSYIQPTNPFQDQLSEVRQSRLTETMLVFFLQ